MQYRYSSALSVTALLALLSACVSPAASWEAGTQTSATPQRPTYSNSTYTTAPGTIELDSGMLLDPNTVLATPTTVKYGVDDRSEAFVGFSPGTAVRGAGVGFGDVLLGWRQRLTEQQVGNLSLAYQGTLKLPTADDKKGLGNGEVDALFAGIGTLPMEDWSATGFAEIGLVGDPVGSSSDIQFALAGAADRRMEGNTAVFGEVAGVFIADQNVDAVFTTLGGSWSPVPGLVLDTAIVLGLSNDAPDFQLLIGFTRNLGRASGYAPRTNW